MYEFAGIIFRLAYKVHIHVHVWTSWTVYGLAASRYYYSDQKEQNDNV